MTAAQHAAPTASSRLRGIPGRLLLRLALTAATLAILAVTLVDLADGEWGDLARHAGYHGYVLLWILAATFVTRTVSWLDALRFWLIGFFPVMLVSYLLTDPFEGTLGADSNAQLVARAPIVEELAKVVPLALYVLLVRRRRLHPSVTDLAVLGFALGAGFAFHEDALWGRITSGGFELSFWGVVVPTFLREPVFVAGHGGWTLVGAVAMGLFFVQQHHRVAWLIPPAALALVILDHAAVNYDGARTSTLSAVLLDGHLVAYIAIGALVLALAHDAYVLRWTGRRDPLFPALPVRRHLRTLLLGGGGSRWRRLSREFRYRRLRNATHVDLYRARASGHTAREVDRGAVVTSLRRAAQRAGVDR